MDQLYYNANIYSIDKDNRQYSALGVKNGRIVFLGNDEEAARITVEKRIDFGGKTVLPGFIDSHLHMLNYAFVSSSYKMFDVDSIEAVIEEGKRLVGELDGQDAQNAQNGQDVKDAQNTQNTQDASKWLYGRGWNNQKFSGEKRLLTRQDLDRISTTHPIFFIRVCGHAAAVNSKALEIVLQTKNAKHYMDQIDIEKGILTEAAVKLCYNAMNAPSVAQIKGMIISAQKDLNRCGITSVQSDNFLSLPGRDRKSIVRAYEELDREGKLTVRVREQASFTSFEEMKEFIDEGYRTGQGSDFYRIGPVKLYENAIEAYGKKDRRLAINHLQVVSADLFDRMKKSDILAFIQPVFVASDKYVIREWIGELL